LICEELTGIFMCAVKASVSEPDQQHWPKLTVQEYRVCFWVGPNPKDCLRKLSSPCRTEHQRGQTVKRLRRVPAAKPHRQISQASLKRRMSEIISLRERLAQAELEAGRVAIFLKEATLPELMFDEPQIGENA
jgi:hypothetical protein